MKSEKHFSINPAFSATKTQRHKVSQRFSPQSFFRFHISYQCEVRVKNFRMNKNKVLYIPTGFDNF